MEKNTQKNAYHHGDLYSSMIKIGKKELEEKGIKAFSLREISKKAGVSHMAAYRHFKNKDEILLVIARGGFEILAVDIQEAIQADLDSAESIIEAGTAYVAFATKFPQTHQLMFGSYFSQKFFSQNLKSESDKTLGNLFSLVENGVSDGLFSNNVSPQYLAYSAWAFVHGIAILIQNNHLKSGQMDETRIKLMVRSLGQVLLNGMLA